MLSKHSKGSLIDLAEVNSSLKTNKDSEERDAF
jgi:hypothetical protein